MVGVKTATRWQRRDPGSRLGETTETEKQELNAASVTFSKGLNRLLHVDEILSSGRSKAELSLACPSAVSVEA